MSLRTPVPVTDVDELGAVHIMAVGGVSMSGLAAMLAGRGVSVSGCDRGESPARERLRRSGVRTMIGHDPAHLDGIDTLLVSSAIAASNPELAEAQRRGLRIVHRSALLAALMRGRRGIGIAGSHGKTTTSAMVVDALWDSDPSYHVGAALARTGTGAAEAPGRDYVIEADESDGSFLQYECEIVAITNIEADHLDNWGTPERYAEGFWSFASAPSVRHVVACADDPASAALIERLRANGRDVVTFGTSDGADVRLRDVSFPAGGARAQISYAGQGGELALQVPGLHNLMDAACAYAVARVAGTSDDVARARLGEFRGTARRFEAVATVDGVRIVDDYAHHPTEVAATLVAARAQAGDGRVVALFQPHLFTRTRDFAAEFGAALAEADAIVVTDIYPAREEPIAGVSGELVADAVRTARPEADVHYVPALDDAPAALASIARPGDLVLTIGAGSVTGVGPRLAQLLGSR